MHKVAPSANPLPLWRRMALCGAVWRRVAPRGMADLYRELARRADSAGGIEALTSLVHTDAKAANDAAMREDTIECKRIRRELQAFGISSIPLNTETPLSPIAETSGWGKEAGGDKRAGGGKTKSVGLGRGRASGSMAALQKGNNRKSKHEWRGPPRNPKEAAAAAAAQAAAAERAIPRDGHPRGKGQRDRADGKDTADEGEDKEGGEGAGDGEGKEGMDVE